jgi:mRNA interferase RelE/StbE
VTYRVEIAPAAERQIRKLSAEVRRRLEPRLDALANDPRPPGAEKLAGAEDSYRIRVATIV